MTNARRSIAFPVAALLVVCMATVMLLGTVLTLIVILSIGGEDRLQINTSELARTLTAAVTYDADGNLTLNRLKLTRNLVKLAEAQPAYWYVIEDGRQVLTRGSQPAEARRVFEQTPREVQYSEFRYRQDNRDMLGIRSISKDGGLKIVTVGGIVLSNWETVLVALVPGPPAGLVTLLSLILVATTSIAIVIVRGTIASPVQRVVRSAAQIDGLPNGRRISDADTPSELKPMVAAFNTALTRIDAAFTAQRSFLANAAHELRTPLTKMRLKVEQVPHGELRDGLIHDTTRLGSIVTTLLQLARLSGQSLTFTETDLAAVARVVASDQVPMALKQDIEIELRAPAGPVPTFGSEAAIRVALENLILNAVRHANGTKLIVVEVLPSAEIRVIDHGTGIPADERGNVLQPFVRGKRSTGEGTGLGLAIVGQIMDAHGGTVLLAETSGGGLTVRLLFPAAASNAPASTVSNNSRLENPRDTATLEKAGRS
ncbi:sensor histidine kinase [Rhizobium lusitanum]|uniref:histidine kinase n=1 Tax=Rhizobium lusitanum TaxID=293958 RepID=A0A7X0IUH3_9HYPH|nr:HAMP domain-containing sensor histidine kinase [Rhizobium lusitanum]MBB6486958.1 signal transduction histidine kinase [Rhizobium lusitanum]